MLPAAIIVVTYNHASYIEPCLRALLALEPGPQELLVIDNASSDGTPQLIKQRFPEVRLIEAGANLGFAGANNLAVNATSAATIVLANPDLVVRPGWLQAMLRPAEAISQECIVGGKLLFPDGRLQHAGGRLPLPLALGQHYGHGEPDHGQYDALRPVEYVTGAALACPRSLWERLGGMDGGFYPAYYEEVDLCLRARIAGHRVIYTPQAVATHSESSGTGGKSPAFYLYFHRNRLRFLFKHFQQSWHLHTWLPAELHYLRAVVDESELQALAAVYLAYQVAAYENEREAKVSLADLSEGRRDGGETELQWVMRQLRAKASVQHRPPGARWAPVARLRGLLSRLAVADELVPLVQQQNDLNAAVVEAFDALVRQRRAADAAVLLQGMLLARVACTPRRGAGGPD